MEFEFEIKDRGAAVIAYKGDSPFVEVPEMYEGYPVTEIGAYAFSKMAQLQEVRLPKTVRKIGRYAFYGCAALEKLTLTDTVTDVAGGVFTGCRLEKIEMDLYAGEKCCLRDLVAENRYCLEVTLRYHRVGDDRTVNGRTEMAKLIFPEHYEEAVENTPARIVMTEYHGSGGNYRQCVYNKEVDYKRYDTFFVYAKAREAKEIILELVFGRLLYPYRLTTEAQERYEEYLKTEIAEAAVFLVKQEDERGLKFLTERSLWTEEGIDAAIGAASVTGKTHLVSMLMEEKHRSFPRKKKVFEW